MTILFNLPVPPKPYYRGLKVLDGASYLFTIKWNGSTKKWYMDIKGLSNDVDIKGKAIMCGVDLLRAHGYFELGELWCIDNSDADEDPTYDDFGTRWTLEYTPKPVVTPAAAVVHNQDELEVWVEISPYDATSVAAVIAYGSVITMGEDLVYSTFDDYLDDAYGSNVGVEFGLADNWADVGVLDLEAEPWEIFTFAEARIREPAG